MQSVTQRKAAGIMCLRAMNPYVSAAVSEWAKRAGHGQLLPRQHGLLCQAALAGELFTGEGRTYKFLTAEVDF